MGTRSNTRLATIHRGAASLLVLLVVVSMGACADIWGISDRELTSSGTGGTAGTGAVGGTTGTAGKGGGGTGGTMGECTVDANCVDSQVGPKCDPETKTCVECLPGPNDNCDFGLYCDATKSCFIGCANDGDCNSNGATTPLKCNVESHLCVECDASKKCPPGSKCMEGTCLPGCDAGAPCPNSDWECCSDKCLNVSKDVQNCGACNDPCVPSDSTNWICLDGGCVFQSCNPGHADCDQDLSKGNGCEVSTDTSIANCGKCNTPCTVANGTPACVGGLCAVEDCNSPYSDCNLMAEDGCESNNNTDPNHCGNCSTSCAGAFANAQATCDSGTCQFDMCNIGFGNCNNVLSDGCEVDVTTSLANCGSCDSPCSPPNAVPKCEAVMCGSNRAPAVRVIARRPRL
ncbi:MAG: hypothetical protein IPK82_32115 [Polyangiaceae bacterium]|nr:hypothetical protein [Polyangiaceae bacterium]